MQCFVSSSHMSMLWKLLPEMLSFITVTISLALLHNVYETFFLFDGYSSFPSSYAVLCINQYYVINYLLDNVLEVDTRVIVFCVQCSHTMYLVTCGMERLLLFCVHHHMLIPLFWCELGFTLTSFSFNSHSSSIHWRFSHFSFIDCLFMFITKVHYSPRTVTYQ